MYIVGNALELYIYVDTPVLKKVDMYIVYYVVFSVHNSYLGIFCAPANYVLKTNVKLF
jgi:hypothetical protein